MEPFQESTYYHHVNDNQQITPEKHRLLTDTKSDHFVVDDLLVFPTDDVAVEDDNAYVADTSTESSAAVDSCNSSATGDDVCRSFVDTQLPNLYVPHDDIAEFEWLSNFMEESFSSEDLQKLQLISGIKTPSKYSYETTKGTINDLMFNVDMTIPGKARTKRSRAVSCNWASQLLVKSPIAEMSSNSESNIAQTSTGKKKLKTKEFDDKSCRNDNGRKCFHCATDKTPQWRSGPMGPKTLCNACGVRYKSGRLVPEYRPAASPTFVLTKHSNSHRKVLELQRQKSQYHHQQRFLNHQNVMLHTPNHDEYLIHQHMSHDYRQLI